MSYDRDVELATSSPDGSNDWEKIIAFCNRVSNSIGSTAMQLALTAIFKRIKTSSDYRVQLQAITLLESCAGNCGKLFQTELANQQSLAEIRSIITGSHYNSQVVAKMKEVLASWTAEFQHQANFAPIRQLYDSLRKEGISFVPQGGQASSKPAENSAEDDIAKAIRLSLEEANKFKSKSSSSGGGSSNAASSSTLYPSLSAATQPAKPAASTQSKGHVRAIYDFDAAEDNELTFKAGELIELIDDSDQNWWKGRTSLGTGLFPANFVSKNIQRDPEPVVRATTDKKKEKKKEKVTTVSLEKIDLCLEMLKSADATDLNQAENETTQELEEECKQMRSLVSDKIKALEKQEDHMEDVSRMYHEAIATYKRLLMETAYKAPPTAANTQTVSDPSGGNYGNQPVASGNQYLSSYAPLPVYGQQQPELSSMNVRYSPEMSRAHPPAAGLVQQQQPLPQVPPIQSVTSLPPPAYQAPLQGGYNPPATGNYQAPPSYQVYPTQNLYTSTPLL